MIITKREMTSAHLKELQFLQKQKEKANKREAIKKALILSKAHEEILSFDSLNTTEHLDANNKVIKPGDIIVIAVSVYRSAEIRMGLVVSVTSNNIAYIYDDMRYGQYNGVKRTVTTKPQNIIVTGKYTIPK